MSSTSSIRSRRDFLRASSVASLAPFLPTAARAQSASDAQPSSDAQSTSGAIGNDRDPISEIPSRDTVLKFHPDGSRRAFAGNTVLCHLPQQCRSRDAIAALSEALRTSPFAGKLGVLPNDSYHMTVFSGPNDQGRSAQSWPKDIPLDAPIAECNRLIGERMAAFRTGCEFPLRVGVNRKNTLAYGRACTLRVSPENEAEEAKIRGLRDRLSEAFRLLAKDHATYAFHITLAYQMAPFTAEEQSSYQAILQEHVPAILAAAPVIQLGLPEFCTFEDMYRFEIRTLLRS